MEGTAVSASQQKGYKEQGRDFLFKEVERKGLESEEKSRSTNLSHRMP